MIVKTVKNFLLNDYFIVSSIKSEDKLNNLHKINIIIWQYCLKFVHLFTNVCIVGILVFYLFLKFTKPALVAFIFIAILSFIEYKFLKIRSNYQDKHFSNAFNKFNSCLLDIVHSTKEIKINNKEEYFLNEISNSSKKYANLSKDRCYNNVFHIYFTEISIMITFIVVLFVLFFTTNFDNQLLISSISTICVIILRLTPAINRAQSALYSINSNEKVVQEFLKLDSLFQEKDLCPISNDKIEFKNEIVLKNVSFKYPDKFDGLKNINLKINKGDFIGIIGKSGCYKTTLALIISGLFQPLSGEILIDGKKIGKNDIKRWQNNVALLSQDFILLDEITKNIDEKILNKLDLNQNLNKNELSFGQKQRIALASILEQNKEIIILDEATSALDVLSEEKINNLLLELKNSKTIISIAHRFQILKHCTKIVYMDNGEMIDCDTFSNLSDKYPEIKTMIELSSFNI